MIDYAKLSGMQKAALMMLALGRDASVGLFKKMSDQEVEMLTGEIVKLGYVPSAFTRKVVQEFREMMQAHDYLEEGGFNYAKEILKTAFGDQEALEMLKKVKSALRIRGFNILRDVDANQLLTFLQKEHPQTVALVLTQLSATQAASILQELPEEQQPDIVKRLSRMERVNPEVIRVLENVLESRVDLSRGVSKLGGVKTAAEILNLVGASTEKTVMSELSQTEPLMATEIKNLMFVFEDIIGLDDRSIQKVLKEVDSKELSLALKVCSDELKGKILANMSSRAAEMIEEELEYMPPVRLREVEEVQQKVVDIIRRLEEEGQLVLAKGEEDQLV
ncbi:MAG: flagellar motor switch protein FliG [Candidatus Delongbacteria bacterium]|nr:flagellar motor switch protein FliG [bacterium]MBL7033717.1 flagellar motor switch protein FliG [Candidatus Delongbacteria bacterium]